MYLRHLSLSHFRNYARLELDLPARIHVLQGENAQGKTNLLEAIYYLATTRSPLASNDRQLISWAADIEPLPHAHLAASYTRAGQDHTLECVLQREPATEPGGQPSLRRQICVDGRPRRALDAIGRLIVVLFLPEDIALVAGAPGERRRYLDITLCQIDPAYCRDLAAYNRVTAQRNALLKQVRERRASADSLAYWDEQLAQLGARVIAARLRTVSALNRHATEIHPALTGARERLHLEYVASVPLPTDAEDLGALQQDFARALIEVRRQELARGFTLVGPHRDDLRFQIDGADATIYGSRGQQRTVALALKLAEVRLMTSLMGESPLLLLDDVLSELDRSRAAHLLAAVGEAEQVLITTTDLAACGEGFLREALLWRVEGGRVLPLHGIRAPDRG